MANEQTRDSKTSRDMQAIRGDANANSADANAIHGDARANRVDAHANRGDTHAAGVDAYENRVDAHANRGDTHAAGVDAQARPIRVGVVGANGRMGQEVCRAVDADPALQLVARLDIADSLDELATAQTDVAVDFTVASAARRTLGFLADNSIHAVVGTSGFETDDFTRFAEMFNKSNCLIAPNFAIGAVLMMRFAELAAPHFATAEIIEYHHNAKVDAPSGTAMHTALRIAKAAGHAPDQPDQNGFDADPTQHEALVGARGGVVPGNVRVHAVRMRGVVANQEVLFGTTGQTLTIRHDTIDRTSFMPGVLLACRRIAEFEGLTLGLDAFLNL